MNYWLIKSDPQSYGWEEMKKDGETLWDGVRNYQARNNMKLIKEGELALFYHSNTDKAIMGEVVITKEYYQDPTSDDPRWCAVDLKFAKEYSKPVTLAQIKDDQRLKDILLVRQPRLSVMPIKVSEYDIISKYAQK